MKITIKTEVNVSYLKAQVYVRYWEDTFVSGVEDTVGRLIPLRVNDCWCPLINLANGIIIGWEQGTTAEVHYKVCDKGHYELLDQEKRLVKSIDGYVPDLMCPGGNGYGDYIIMEIDKDGFIKNWNPTLEEFCELGEE
jgi:hypothetical protein